MRFILACSVIPILLSGCAVQGTIVEKRSRLRPDSSMIGTQGDNSFVFRGPVGTSLQPTTVGPQFWTETGGSYKFLLRDQAGNVRSQLVTPAVFAQYNVGDYFNDLIPPAPRSAKDQTTKVTVHHQQFRHRRTAQTHRTHRRLAKHHRHQKAIAHRASSKSREG